LKKSYSFGSALRDVGAGGISLVASEAGALDVAGDLIDGSVGTMRLP
jgi:hypothetical protein